MKARIRKLATFVEETRTEMGRPIDPPTRRAAAVAVIENPFAGRYVEDLSELMAIGEELGELLTQRAVAALGIPGPSAESYGKAAAVGEDGNWSTPLPFCIRSSDRPFAKFSARAQRSFLRPKSAAAWAWCWIFPSVIKMRPSCAVILTAWKCASTMLPGPMKSWWRSRSTTVGVRSRGWAG